MVTSQINGDYWRRLIGGATERLLGGGYTLLCFSPGSQTQFPTEFLQLVQAEFLSGVVISPSSFQSMDAPPASHRLGSRRSATGRCDADACLQFVDDLPIVYLGGWASGVPSVWVQNAVGIRLLMRHLTQDCGRRRIAFIRGPAQHVEADARFRAWHEFCIEHSLPHEEELVASGDFTLPSGDAAATTILKNCANEPPDAFVVSNDHMAIGALRTLRARGLSVPDDISVVGFDDLEADLADPPLTTVRHPVFEMGYRAAEVLVKRVQKEPFELEHMFSPELVLRASSIPNQPKAAPIRTETGVGACAFLEGAYSSAEWLVPLLRGALQHAQNHTDGEVNRDTQVPVALQQGLARTKARELELIRYVRRIQTSSLEQLSQALTRAEHLRELNDAVCLHLPLLGLERLTLASLCDPVASRPREARVAVHCSIDRDDPPPELLGMQLPCEQIVALEVQRKGGTLRLAQPLHLEGRYVGILLVSGTLLDSQMINELGELLVRAVARFRD